MQQQQHIFNKQATNTFGETGSARAQQQLSYDIKCITVFFVCVCVRYEHARSTHVHTRR